MQLDFLFFCKKKKTCPIKLNYIFKFSPTKKLRGVKGP